MADSKFSSGWVNGVYWPIMIISGENISPNPFQHVFQDSQCNPSLVGHQSKLLTYVSEKKTTGEFITSGYEPHKRTPEIWCCAGDYIQPKQHIPKISKKCPHEGVEGVLNELY